MTEQQQEPQRPPVYSLEDPEGTVHLVEDKDQPPLRVDCAIDLLSPHKAGKPADDADRRPGPRSAGQPTPPPAGRHQGDCQVSLLNIEAVRRRARKEARRLGAGITDPAYCSASLLARIERRLRVVIREEVAHALAEESCR